MRRFGARLDSPDDGGGGVPAFGLARLTYQIASVLRRFKTAHNKFDKHREILLKAKNPVPLAMVPVHNQYYG